MSHNLHARMRPGLCQNVADVIADGGVADVELVGNGVELLIFRKQAQNLPLPVGQRRESRTMMCKKASWLS